VLALVDVKDMLLSKLLMVADFQNGAVVDKQLKEELAHWGPVIKASGFTPQQ
jgi:Ni,Fe-hydrogenase III large subunit